MKTILLIEDNPLNRRLFFDILTAGGAKVIQACSALEAIMLLKKVTPDLILTDIGLPRISGIELCYYLKRIKKTKKIPLIAITAFAFENDKKTLLSLGFDEVLIKPIDIFELLNACGLNIIF